MSEGIIDCSEGRRRWTKKTYAEEIPTPVSVWKLFISIQMVVSPYFWTICKC